MKHRGGESPHFTGEQWCDFVRDTVSGAVRKKMLAHLESGCGTCRQTAEWLTGVVKLAGEDAAVQVPEPVVQTARALFQAQPAGFRWTDALRQIPARLMWTGQPGFQPAGVRSAPGVKSGSQRMLFRAGDYAVDLNCESGPGEQGEIVGQIANERDGNEMLEGILVQVIATGKMLGETATNRFGEFIIGTAQRKRCTLRLALRERNCRIDIAIPRPNRK